MTVVPRDEPEPVAWASEETLRAFGYGLFASTSPKRTDDDYLPLYDHPAPAVVQEPVDLREAVAAYFAHFDTEPEKDCRDTESGQEEPGAEMLACDWAHEEWRPANGA